MWLRDDNEKDVLKYHLVVDGGQRDVTRGRCVQVG